MTKAQILKMTKYELARTHVANGGLMGLATYLKWTKEELQNAVLEDNGINPWEG